MASSPELSMRDRWSVVLVSDRLDYYDADKDLKIVRSWYDMVKTSLNEKTSMAQLEAEAKDETGKKGSSMKLCLERAKTANKSVNGLMHAENLVVTMYTDNEFYKEYNGASSNKNWAPYKVYTTLLLSALKKLARIKPLKTDAKLYRGLSRQLSPPDVKRIFWKAFTSTSLDLHVAQEFAGANGIVLEFQPLATHFGAQVGDLSYFKGEEEIVLLPFEVFDYLNFKDQMFQFKTSKTQELLH